MLFNVLTIGAFLVVVIVPVYRLVTSPIKEISETENRPLVSQPSLREMSSVGTFISDVEAFLVDHFGYREELIQWNNLMRVRYFAKSPVEDVVIGDDGWLYLNTNDLMNDYRGVVGLPKSGIDDLNGYFEDRRAWLEARDIAYLVVFVPDKQSIYPEFLPSGYRDVVNPNNTRLDNFMASQSAAEILDLRKVLLQAKDESLLYARYDTHWNQRGAYIAYLAIMDRIVADFPGVASISPEMLRWRTFEGSGDLARLMSMEDEMIEVLPRTAVPRRDRCAEQVEDNMTTCEGRPLRVIMFHDSFGEVLRHFMSESFGEIMYVQERYVPARHQSLIDNFQPDLVIDEIVERWLSNFDNGDDE